MKELRYRKRVEIIPIDSKGKIYGGFYPDGSFALPGGGIDPGETPQQAAARELKEETGLEAGTVKLLPIPPRKQTYPEGHPIRPEGYDGTETHFAYTKLKSDKPGEASDPWSHETIKRQGTFARKHVLKALKAVKAPLSPGDVEGRIAALREVVNHEKLAWQKRAYGTGDDHFFTERFLDGGVPADLTPEALADLIRSQKQTAELNGVNLEFSPYRTFSHPDTAEAYSYDADAAIQRVLAAAKKDPNNWMHGADLPQYLMFSGKQKPDGAYDRVPYATWKTPQQKSAAQLGAEAASRVWGALSRSLGWA